MAITSQQKYDKTLSLFCVRLLMKRIGQQFSNICCSTFPESGILDQQYNIFANQPESFTISIDSAGLSYFHYMGHIGHTRSII